MDSKVRTSNDEKKASPTQSPSSVPPKAATLALPSSEKRTSARIEPRRLSDAKVMDGHSDRSSDQSDSRRIDDHLLLASPNALVPSSNSSDSLREAPPSRRRSVELMNKGRIGSYEYEKASGALMGKYTHMGYKLETNTKVAIRIIEKKNPGLEAMRIEYTLLRNISHPNMLQVYDILEDDQHVYFVMEYAMRGRLLYEIGSNGPMHERELKPVMQQIVAAVLHNYELRHAVFREMELDYFTYFRAENVFLDQDGNIKVGAYGLIDLRKPSRTWLKQVGFPSFAAPEILKGKTYLLGVDAWTLGVLMYVLCKASFPFTGETVDDVLKSTANPPRLDVGSEDMRSLCTALLQVNTFTRLPMVEISKHAWWTSSSIPANPELQRQHSRKDTDDKNKKPKSLFGLFGAGKDKSEKKTSDARP